MESFDFIGERPCIYIKNSKYFRTTLGGILCVLMIICTFLVSLYFGRDVWEKKNPIVNSAEVTMAIPLEMPLDKIDFEFIFGVSNDLGYITDPTVLDIRPQLFSYSNEKASFFTIPFNITVCKSEVFFEENRALVQQLNVMDKFYCIPGSELAKGLGMYKTFGEDGFKIFNIQLYPCRNNTNSNGVVCKPQETIDNLLGSTYLSTFFTDYSIDTNNFTQPYTKYFKNEFTAISKDSFTAFILFFQHYFINSDNGFLFQEFAEKRIPKFDLSKNMFSVKPNTSGLFVELSIQLRNSKVTYFRKYLKLQELMAQIGGVANLFTIIIYLLNYVPALASYKSYLINSYFEFPSESSTVMKNWLMKNSLINPNSIKILKSSKANITRPQRMELKDNDGSFVSKLVIGNEQDKVKKEPPPFNNKSKNTQFKLKFGMIESLCFIFRGRRDFTKHIIDSTFPKIVKNISIESIYNMMLTTTKLKYLLLTGNENQLMDEVGNPQILLDDTSNPYQHFSNYVLNHSYDHPSNNILLNYTLDENQRKLDVLDKIYFNKS